MPQPSTPRDGLQSPEGPLLGAMEGPRGWSRRRVVAQIVGLLVSLSLLGWAISLALSDRNQASWEAMRSAHWSTVLTLIALSLLSLTLNGLMFWITLRPLRRLKPMEVVGVNAISTFLSVLPFKVGLATRVLIHHRRDGVPFRHIVAWMAGMGALALATLLPLAAAGLWRRDLDALWWLVAVGGLLLCNGVGVALGRIAKSRPWLARLSLGSHQIVRDPVAVGGHLLLRLLDIAILAGRFTAAAAIAGHALPPDQAILIATTYFLLSVLAPAGTLGFREAGVAALGLARGLDEGGLALIALIVSVAEIASAAALAIPAAIVLRVDHLIAQKRPAPPSAESGLVN